MEQRVKDSIEVLQIMSRGGLVVMDSGGKDSSVLTHIVCCPAWILRSSITSLQ